MISQKELSLLYQILSDDNQTFEKISESFENNFPKESYSKVGTTLSILLKDKLLNIHQRIISYYILYDISKKEKMESNPYLSIILEMLKNSQNKNELNFLIDYLYNQINYLNITIQNYLKDNTKELKMNLIQIQMQWGKYYKDMLNKKNIDLKTNDKNRPVIYDRRKSDIKNIDNHNNLNVFLNNIDDNKNNESELNLNFFSPNYMSYYPKHNNNIIFDSEPIWIMPSLRHNFIWENKLDLIK
jgi:hypothetical protein